MQFLLPMFVSFLLLVGNVLNFTVCQTQTQAENRIGFGYMDSQLAYQNGGGLYRNFGYSNYADGYPYPVNNNHYQRNFFGGVPRSFASTGGDLNIGEDYGGQRFDVGNYNRQLQLPNHNLAGGNLYGSSYVPHNGFGISDSNLMSVARYNPYNSADYAGSHNPMHYTSITHSGSYPAYNRDYTTGFTPSHFISHPFAGAGTSLGVNDAAVAYNGHFGGVSPYQPAHNFNFK